MQIHLLPQIPASLARIHEIARELKPEQNIVRTSAPLPVAHIGHRSATRHLRRFAMVTVVARARFDGALGARPGYRMGDRGTGDRIEKGCFPASYVYTRKSRSDN